MRFARGHADYAQVAPGFDHRVGDADGKKFFHGAVHRVTFGDATQVKRNTRPEEVHRAFFRIQLDQPKVNSRQHCLEFFIRRQAIFLPDETPEVGERADGDVKTAFGSIGNFPRFGDDAK